MALVLPLALVALEALLRPQIFGDEVYVWGHKANAIATTGRIDPSSWTYASARGAGYPFALPVAAALHSVGAGRFDGMAMRAFALLGTLSAACAFAALLEGRLSRIPRVIAAFGFAALPIVFELGAVFMGDLPFVAAVALAGGAVARGAPTRTVVAHLCALPLIRMEGALMAPLLATIHAFDAAPRERARRLGISLLVLALAVAPWLALYPLHGLVPVTGEPWDETARGGGMLRLLASPGDLAARCAGFCGHVASRISPVGWENATDTLGPLSPFGAFVPALLLLLAASPAVPVHAGRCILVGLAIVAAQIACVVLAPHYEAMESITAPARAALHILPALVLLVPRPIAAFGHRRTGSGSRADSESRP